MGKSEWERVQLWNKYLQEYYNHIQISKRENISFYAISARNKGPNVKPNFTNFTAKIPTFLPGSEFQTSFCELRSQGPNFPSAIWILTLCTLFSAFFNFSFSLRKSNFYFIFFFQIKSNTIQTHPTLFKHFQDLLTLGHSKVYFIQKVKIWGLCWVVLGLCVGLCWVT